MGKYGLSDKAYNRLLQIHKLDARIKELVDYYGVATCEKGYMKVNYEGLGIDCIEKADALGIFKDDTEATKQAIKDGVKIIPLEELPTTMPAGARFFGYVDNYANRQTLYRKYGRATVPNNQPKKVVTKSNTMEEKVEELKKRFDTILDVYTVGDFTEVVGRVGGDVLTFRVYKDGRVTEK